MFCWNNEQPECRQAIHFKTNEVTMFFCRLVVIASRFALIISTADTPTQESLKPRSPRRAFNQNLNPLSHPHICSFWQKPPLDWKKAVCPPQPAPPAAACPPRSSDSVSSLHSPFFFLFFLSFEAPQIHFRVGGSEDWCWQDTNAICSSSIRRSKSVPHSAGQIWTRRTNLTACWSRTRSRLSNPLIPFCNFYATFSPLQEKKCSKLRM